jgi:hypothetical protein
MSPQPIPYSLGYLIAAIEDLAKLAETNGLGTLAYLLESREVSPGGFTSALCPISPSMSGAVACSCPAF